MAGFAILGTTEPDFYCGSATGIPRNYKLKASISAWKENRRKQFICFLLLFKEPYKGEDLSAWWVLLTVFETTNACHIGYMPYQWIWSLTSAKGFCFAYSCFVYMNYLFIHLFFLFNCKYLILLLYIYIFLFHRFPKAS